MGLVCGRMSVRAKAVSDDNNWTRPPPRKPPARAACRLHHLPRISRRAREQVQACVCIGMCTVDLEDSDQGSVPYDTVARQLGEAFRELVGGFEKWAPDVHCSRLPGS